MADKREPIDLDTWHEVCRRREAGQPLEILGEPLKRHAIQTETPGQFLWRNAVNYQKWAFSSQMLKFGAIVMLVWALIVLMLFLFLA